MFLVSLILGSLSCTNGKIITTLVNVYLEVIDITLKGAHRVKYLQGDANIYGFIGGSFAYAIKFGTS